MWRWKSSDILGWAINSSSSFEETHTSETSGLWRNTRSHPPAKWCLFPLRSYGTRVMKPRSSFIGTKTSCVAFLPGFQTAFQSLTGLPRLSKRTSGQRRCSTTYWMKRPIERDFSRQGDQWRPPGPLGSHLANLCSWEYSHAGPLPPPAWPGRGYSKGMPFTGFVLTFLPFPPLDIPFSQLSRLTFVALLPHLPMVSWMACVNATRGAMWLTFFQAKQV